MEFGPLFTDDSAVHQAREPLLQERPRDGEAWGRMESRVRLAGERCHDLVPGEPAGIVELGDVDFQSLPTARRVASHHQ